MFAEAWSINVLTDIVIDKLANVMAGVGVDMSNEVEIIVVVAAVIDSEYVVGVAYDADVLTAVSTIGLASDVGVDVMTDVNVKGLVVMVTTLEFVLPSP